MLGLPKEASTNHLKDYKKGFNTMKLIIAYIQPQKLNDVKQALYEKDIFKLSVTNALGCGQQKGYHENYRGADVEVNLLKKILVIKKNEIHSSYYIEPLSTYLIFWGIYFF